MSAADFSHSLLCQTPGRMWFNKVLSTTAVVDLVCSLAT